ncbi:uncharacterized protein LOC128405034 [Podarcis raffonei]|uniref:uncharacterized protein LOC128405034 n=1 Tax=Podarcis raffonei TaxID=65483 RepID=UPI0023292D57|nr:uncharacterized protein LOC128405034 [Podarcis raffonei]
MFTPIALRPSLHGWGTTGHLSVPLFAPLQTQHRDFATARPMNQLYRQPHLQLVQVQPPGLGPIRPTTFQDGMGLYHHGTLAPIPLEQRNPIVRIGSAVPMPPAANNEMLLVLQQVEPQPTLEPAPATGYFPASQVVQVPHGLQGTGAVSAQVTDVLGASIAQEKLEETQLNNAALNVVEHPPPPPQPADEESLLRDEFQLPEDLLSKYPEIETLIASLEPLIPEGLFPPLASSETTKGSEGMLAEACLPEEALGSHQSLTPVSTRSFRVEAKSIADAPEPCKEVPKVLHPHSFVKDLNIKGTEVTILRKGSATQGQASLPSTDEQDTKLNKPSGNPLIQRPVYILKDIGFPFPPDPLRPKSLKKTQKSKCDATQSKGKHEGNGKIEGKPISMTGRRKWGVAESQTLIKLPRITLEPIPEGSRKCQPTHEKSMKPKALPEIKGKRKGISTKAEVSPKFPKCILSIEGTSITGSKESHPSQEKKCKEKRKLPFQEEGSLKNEEDNLDRGNSKHCQAGLEKNEMGPETKEKATVKGSTPGIKGKKIKLEERPLVPIPRTNLAWHMMESVQVFHPLGKKKSTSMAARNLPPLTATSSSSGNSQAPQEVPLLKSLHKPVPTTQPPSLPRPAPHLARRLAPFSVPRQQSSSSSSSQRLPTHCEHPLPKPLPKPPATYERWPPTSQLSHTSWLRPHPTNVGRLPTRPHPPAVPRQSSRFLSNIRPSVTRAQPLQPPASPPYRGDTFIPWRTPPDDLEESLPITEEQRPIREAMKRQAQREREEASHWTSIGRVKYFVEREKEMNISNHYGYPWRH